MDHDALPVISILIVSFNTKDLLLECLNAVRRETEGIPHEIIVIDNCSNDGSAELIETRFPGIILIKNTLNQGFAAANNRGFQIARGRYLVLLNTDAFLSPGTLNRAIEKMDADPQVGVAGARLVGRDGSWQPSARQYPSILNDFLHLSGLAAKYPSSTFFGRCDRTWAPPEDPCETDWVPGAFSILRKSVLDKVGGFDERFFLYYEEVDLCLRIKAAGYKICYWPDLVVTHLGGESSKNIKDQLLSSSGSQLALWRMRSALLYYRKHQGCVGASAALTMELFWHKLRAIKNSFGCCPEQQSKKRESQTYVQLLKKAWKETDGGRLCPPKPW